MEVRKSRVRQPKVIQTVIEWHAGDSTLLVPDAGVADQERVVTRRGGGSDECAVLGGVPVVALDGVDGIGKGECRISECGRFRQAVSSWRW